MLRLLDRSRMFRLAAGLVLVAMLGWAGFAVTLALIPSYGATPEEQTLALPGDELFPAAPINWKHAITIDASPETVWPWIIQMGDDRAAFYSYMFIERMVDPTPGRYVNAERVNAAWQDPQVGLPVIQDALAIRAIQPGEYLLASAPDDSSGLGWTWLWYIRPETEGRTRLNVHMHIQAPEGMDSPLMTNFMELGAFIMQRNMMTGLKVRAEGGGEPAWIEPVEIAIWLAALLVGLVAAGRFVFSPRGARGWWRPLLVGLSAVAVLFIFTFLQPAVWLRAAVDLALLAGLAWGWGPRSRPAGALYPAAQAG